MAEVYLRSPKVGVRSLASRTLTLTDTDVASLGDPLSCTVTVNVYSVVISRSRVAVVVMAPVFASMAKKEVSPASEKVNAEARVLGAS